MANKDLLEIIFENRNKAYGAYPIRREHPNTMRRTVLSLLAGIAICLAAPHLLASFSNIENEKFAERHVVIELEDKVKIEKNKPPKLENIVAEQPKQSFIKPFVPPIVVQNNTKTIETPPDVVSISQSIAAVGKINQPDGEPGGIPEPIETPGNGIIEEPKPSAPEPKIEIFDVPEIPPYFPGGEMELLNFLKKNINYPQLAKETGVEGTVVVSFVVNEKGELTNLKLIKDIGGGCGKEVFRLLNLMPRWRPGEQNGQFVKVKMTLPVKFELAK